MLMRPNADKREYLAPKEVAHELRLHISSVYRAIEKGSLPAVRLSQGGALRVPREALEPEPKETP